MPVYEMTAYPKSLDINGEAITVMPLKPEHETALLDFFLRVSEEDRYYLKEDVTSPAVIARWTRELDYDRTLPMLAIAADGRIVADGTLHRRRSGSRKHIGEVRIVVDPAYRQHGIGSALVRELAAIAHETGLEKLIAEAVDAPRTRVVESMESMGFVRLATLPDHARDVSGRPCDIVISELVPFPPEYAIHRHPTVIPAKAGIQRFRQVYIRQKYMETVLALGRWNEWWEMRR